MENFPQIMIIAAFLAGAIFGDTLAPEGAKGITNAKYIGGYAVLTGAVVALVIWLVSFAS